MFTYVQRWHDFWHESVIVNLKFLNKLKQLIYTQKLAQRLFLFNYVRILNSTFILLLRKKKLRWPSTAVTSKQNAHSKFKSLTANSNHSQQIQITHSKFKLLTANYKSFTSNTNRSHQMQIAHSKYKSLTANTNMVSVKRGLRTADCGLRTADQGQGEKQTEGKMQTAD